MRPPSYASPSFASLSPLSSASEARRVPLPPPLAPPMPCVHGVPLALSTS